MDVFIAFAANLTAMTVLIDARAAAG